MHAALSNPSGLPFLEHVAKNAGARAARGAFLLATNPDVLPCAALKWLKCRPPPPAPPPY